MPERAVPAVPVVASGRALAGGLAVLVTVSVLHAANAQPVEALPDRVIVLGDSLSDVGNAASLTDYLLDEPFYPQHTVGLCNPGEVLLLGQDCAALFYRQSRVSDGPVAVEYLAAHLGLPELIPSFHVVPERPEVGTNYAVAGAKARGTDASGFSRQVDMLLLDQGPRLPSTPLYVIVVGGNDAIDALQSAALPSLEADPVLGDDDDEGLPLESGVQIVSEAVAAIGAGLDRLIGSGARLVMVANLPDLASLPAVRIEARQEGVSEAAAIAAAAAITAAFNEQLGERLARAEADHPGARILSFDLHAAFDEAIAAAVSAGSNVSDACFDSEAYFSSWMARRRFHEQCEPAQDGLPRFDAFAFWDGIHPTGAVHASLGAAMAAAFDSAQRSTPATLRSAPPLQHPSR